MSVLPWHKDKFLAFDIESTGTNPHGDRIVTAAVVYLAGILRPRATTWIVNPGIPIPDEAAAVHGWTTERIQQHPAAVDPAQAVFEITGKIALAMRRGVPLVAMNAPFDLTMLEAEATRHGIEPLSARLDRGIRPVIDPSVLDKQVDPYRKVKGGCRCGCGAENKTLTGLCQHYGVLLGDAHSADADAVAACRLATRIVDRYERLQAYDLEQLHDAQVQWRAEQMDSLRSYFDKNGIEHDGCNPGWPVQFPPAAVAADPLPMEAPF